MQAQVDPVDRLVDVCACALDSSGLRSDRGFLPPPAPQAVAMTASAAMTIFISPSRRVPHASVGRTQSDPVMEFDGDASARK